MLESSGVQATEGTPPTADIPGASESSNFRDVSSSTDTSHRVSQATLQKILLLRLFIATESISFTHFGPRDFRIFLQKH
jgi:hypothetical protein